MIDHINRECLYVPFCGSWSAECYPRRPTDLLQSAPRCRSVAGSD